MISEQFQDDAAMYVLGLLPADEARRLEAAMVRDPDLAALVARLRETAGAIGGAVEPRDPPPALRSRLMSQISAGEESTGAQRSGGNWGWAVAACLAFLAIWLGYERYSLRLRVDNFVIRDHAQQRELDRVQTHETEITQQLQEATSRATAAAKDRADLMAQLAAARTELQAARTDVANLKARDEISQIKIATLASLSKSLPQAMAVVAWDGDTQRGILKTAHIPAAAAGQDYQLWIIDPAYKQPISAGVFEAGTDAHFQPLQSISKAGKFAISLEKKGGAPAGQGPQGPVVLMGE